MDEIAKPQRDAQRTRIEILAAATAVFSEQGYAGAGIREITAKAGVNPALVSRYFGSKEQLYEEVLSCLLRVENITGMTRERFGEQVVAMLCDAEGAGHNPLRMMLLASADPGARAITLRLLEEKLLEPLSRWYGPEEGRARAVRFVLLCSGLTVYRDIYPLAPISGDMDASLRQWLIKTLQETLA